MASSHLFQAVSSLLPLVPQLVNAHRVHFTAYTQRNAFFQNRKIVSVFFFKKKMTDGGWGLDF